MLTVDSMKDNAGNTLSRKRVLKMLLRLIRNVTEIDLLKKITTPLQFDPMPTLSHIPLLLKIKVLSSCSIKTKL